jgi:hypothetical protein
MVFVFLVWDVFSGGRKFRGGGAEGANFGEAGFSGQVRESGARGSRPKFRSKITHLKVGRRQALLQLKGRPSKNN